MLKGHASVWRYWIPFICYSLLILFVSTRPSLDLPRLPLNDKVIHFMEFALYGTLLVRLLWHRYPDRWFRIFVWAWGGVALFAAVDETVQSFIVGRQADVLDWTADVTGGLFGIIMCATLYLLVKRRRCEE